MRDLRVCSSPCPNGVVFGDPPLPSPSPLPASSPEPGLIRKESWERAEKTTQEIVFLIWPTLVADQKRQDITQYVQGLVEHCTGCMVVPYGSVPLRTYLPDGDIDLTAFTLTNAVDCVVSDVHNVLMREEHNEAAPYKVKDIYRIDAEVKLVKCIVEDVVVDISFNQLGGLGTLCFLEQVDRYIGKDHVFKRSIILIKAWCYYESRILGAHHGLISTYALETLVLYILHRFHTSLKGPLSILYTFLEYFSKFDWDNYCISLDGPICKSSLPDIVAMVPKKSETDDLLLSEEFLQICREKFSLSSDRRAFPLKHLNIIDPLKENNNLGRSVNRGNFYRIRSAFKYGARKLGWILSLPEERMATEVKKFFANTMVVHGNNCWKNGQDLTQASGDKASRCLSWPSWPETSSEQEIFVEPDVAFETQRIEAASNLGNKLERQLVKEVSSRAVPELCCHFDGDIKRPEASGNLDARLKNESTGCVVANTFLRTVIPVCSYQAPRSFGFGTQTGKGELDYWSPSDGELAKYSALIAEMSLDCPLEHKEQHLVAKDVASSCINKAKIEFTDPAVLHDANIVSKNVDHIEKGVAGIFGSDKALKFLLNLCGEYHRHYRNLQYGQCCYLYSMSSPMLSSPPLSPLIQNKKPLEPVHRSSVFEQRINPQSNRYNVSVGPRCYFANSFSFSCDGFGEENKRRNGTGTYFPNSISRPYRNNQVPGKRRNTALGGHVPLETHTHINSLAAASPELTASADCRHTVSEPVLGSGRFESSGYDQSNLFVWGSIYTESYSCPYGKLKHGSPRSRKSCSAPLPESDGGTFTPHVPASSHMASPAQNHKPFLNSDEKRVKSRAYHLRNDDDFPPLSTCTP